MAPLKPVDLKDEMERYNSMLDVAYELDRQAAAARMQNELDAKAEVKKLVKKAKPPK